MKLVFLMYLDDDDAGRSSWPSCTGCEDPEHPIHAIQVDVDKVVDSGFPISFQ